MDATQTDDHHPLPAAGLVHPERLQPGRRRRHPARHQRVGLPGTPGRGPQERRRAHDPGQPARASKERSTSSRRAARRSGSATCGPQGAVSCAWAAGSRPSAPSRSPTTTRSRSCVRTCGAGRWKSVCSSRVSAPTRPTTSCAPSPTNTRCSGSRLPEQNPPNSGHGHVPPRCVSVPTVGCSGTSARQLAGSPPASSSSRAAACRGAVGRVLRIEAESHEARDAPRLGDQIANRSADIGSAVGLGEPDHVAGCDADEVADRPDRRPSHAPAVRTPPRPRPSPCRPRRIRRRRVHRVRSAACRSRRG